MKNEFFEKMIEKLMENQKYPKYQLERRFDIFINLFLPEIIKNKIGSKFEANAVIPELPIKKKEGYASFNLDYFVICSQQKTGFLVELKTDIHSCNPEQLKRYKEVRSKGFSAILNDVKDISQKTTSNYKSKYIDLFNKLSKVESIKVLEIIYILPEKGISKLMKDDPKNESNINLITLESLKKMEIRVPFKDEWDIFKLSKLF